MAGLRKFELRKRNSFVILGCEGNNKTEKIYFKNFNSRKCIIKFSTGNSTDPVGIVQDIVNYIHSEIDIDEDDKIYAIFDTDARQNKQQQIEEACKIAEENGIDIIISTPAFELWYLLHYEYTTKTFTSSKALQSELKKKIQDYSKNNNTFLKIKESTNQAIENAKKLEKYQLRKGYDLYSYECNPYTEVYKVVEELIRRNK